MQHPSYRWRLLAQVEILVYRTVLGKKQIHSPLRLPARCLFSRDMQYPSHLCARNQGQREKYNIAILLCDNSGNALLFPKIEILLGSGRGSYLHNVL